MANDYGLIDTETGALWQPPAADSYAAQYGDPPSTDPFFGGGADAGGSSFGDTNWGGPTDLPAFGMAPGGDTALAQRNAGLSAEFNQYGAAMDGTGTRSSRRRSPTRNSASQYGIGAINAAAGNPAWGMMSQLQGMAVQDPQAQIDLAGNEVKNAFDAQAGAATRELLRYGINPNSGRFAGLQDELAVHRAAAEAGARTRMRTTAQTSNFERLMQVAGLAGTNTRELTSAYGMMAGIAGTQDTAARGQDEGRSFMDLYIADQNRRAKAAADAAAAAQGQPGLGQNLNSVAQ